MIVWVSKFASVIKSSTGVPIFMLCFIGSSKNQRVTITNSHPQNHVIAVRLLIGIRALKQQALRVTHGDRHSWAHEGECCSCSFLLAQPLLASPFLFGDQEVLTTSAVIHRSELLILRPLWQSLSMFTFPVNSFMCKLLHNVLFYLPSFL